jgi:hypothetical protein
MPPCTLPTFPANRQSDYEVGEELLRQYVFIHLSEPADKMQLMLAMLHKLYALVSEQQRQSGEALCCLSCCVVMCV